MRCTSPMMPPFSGVEPPAVHGIDLPICLFVPSYSLQVEIFESVDKSFNIPLMGGLYHTNSFHADFRYKIFHHTINSSTRRYHLNIVYMFLYTSIFLRRSYAEAGRRLLLTENLFGGLDRPPAGAPSVSCAHIRGADPLQHLLRIVPDADDPGPPPVARAAEVGIYQPCGVQLVQDLVKPGIA